LWIWLTLGGVFFVDATVTLVRRLMRCERLDQAHRTHAYQWLARRWGSHLRVTVAVLAVDVLWLLPCAAYGALHPSHAATAALIALAPLVVIALAVGSGRREL
jgi:Fuc2NAc and GlcNAc transferase